MFTINGILQTTMQVLPSMEALKSCVCSRMKWRKREKKKTYAKRNTYAANGKAWNLASFDQTQQATLCQAGKEDQCWYLDLSWSCLAWHGAGSDGSSTNEMRRPDENRKARKLKCSRYTSFYEEKQFYYWQKSAASFCSIQDEGKKATS